jgi:hypothetical protein
MAANEGSYVRWQAIAISQLGYSLNLIITLAAASLGFALILVNDNEVTSSCWCTGLLIVSGVSLMVSIALGIWCVLNRLADFRKTAQNARDREKRDGERGHVPPPEEKEIETRLEWRRMEAKKLGERTWVLFHWQVGTFCAGVLALVGTFILAYHARIF